MGGFCVHVIVGALIFTGIAEAAVVLHFFALWVEAQGVSPYVVAGIQTAELVLFAVDILCLGVFICKEAITFIKR